MTAGGPQPVPSAETRPFWAGLAAHELRLPWCSGCGRFEHPRAIRCPRCLREPVWRRISGRASVASWTVVHRPLVPGLAPPYVVGTVCPDEQPDLVLDTRLAAAPQDLRTGTPVEVVYHDDPRGFTVHAFRVRRAADGIAGR
ncbi:Zn-ribbon domain-containing OB-fold protein [Dactylosporangium sp. CA-092794]|uniref:Zn-ribbon domain-containing OB-fold protein n=1 Tax=Dactylosporangium sp. CA-092794 TaxID=3239929 RepID=UPI003D8D77CB